ncbi:hypothetical protein FNV43_RR08225 [Rhamnella rubrinervis]|uniref:Uncharacterized protein n=1 Tax=Rhamnella rubrinervis TaxID=2594499 RepID=A0A8K0HI69_9ROSA|nr:hypothetical protein FNV43_RR08225 [Rhamnella rubrinervis]
MAEGCLSSSHRKHPRPNGRRMPFLFIREALMAKIAERCLSSSQRSYPRPNGRGMPLLFTEKALSAGWPRVIRSSLSVTEISTTCMEVDIFNGKGDFGSWKKNMKVFLSYNKVAIALEKDKTK